VPEPVKALGRRRTVAVAGAGGFVGRALVPALAGLHDVIALGRENVPESGGVTWRACDLFDPAQAEAALAGADAAFYLVHSMVPSARLAQGHFADMDLLCADNFARAARAAGVQHIVYLGGLQPADGEALSAHLKSRLEVEQTLAAHGVPVTTLRAGMILGAGGSSFLILARLVKRLPIMVAPRWTRSRTQCVALEDVVAVALHALAHPELAGRAYDLGSPDVLSYAQLLELTGQLMGRRTRVITLPVRTLNLSLLWVSAITGAPFALVQPLVQSLRHDMVAHDGLWMQRHAGIHALSTREALQRALAGQAALPSPPKARKAARGPASTVLSVQRLPLPEGRDLPWVSRQYERFFPALLRLLFRVTLTEDRRLTFFLRGLSRPLLQLTFSQVHSTPDRQVFEIIGGLLVRAGAGGWPRLEFRSVLDGRYAIAAVQDFTPRLPWPLYVATQAKVHLLVMDEFGKHLALQAPDRDAAAISSSHPGAGP